uniref:Uncharacterized protein n=1 Tax=Thermosporothrix sp. COM3 TaxID=2490863 RepID=A0A455SQ28_9CHLR|nr:hypothetical protein KTC_52380 [Thermosporothrix sp. COM3]
MFTQPFSEGEQGPAYDQNQGQNTANAGSLLVADVGSVFTKVSLFGLVEGQYRLMARGEAPTTVTPPQEDILQGVIQAIHSIEHITGRRFVNEKQVLTPEQPNGDGVDVFIATISAGGSLRLLVLGGVDETLEKLVDQAVSGLYAEIYPLPSPSFQAARASSQTANPQQAWSRERIAQEWERQVSRLRELHPQGALIVGMAQGPAGPHALQEACQLLAVSARELKQQNPALTSAPYSVIYAGAPQYVEASHRLLAGAADFTRAEPLTSQAQLASMSMAVGQLHEQKIIQRLPGYTGLVAWTETPPVATATSLSSLVRFLAQHYSMNVTAIDVGGATTTAMIAGEQGEFIPVVNAGIGVGSSISAILQKVGWQRVARWLPFTISEEEIRQFALQHMTHAESVPTSIRDLQIMQAFAREAMILTMEEAKKTSGLWPDSDLILATGGVLAHVPKFSQAAMMILDALQPKGVTSLVLDRTMLIPQLGAVAAVAPLTAVQVNENDAVTHRLGACVIPFGDLKPGELAVRVGVEYSNGRQLDVDVMAGSMEVIPLGMNEQALLTLYPAPGVDVGLGPGERARVAEEIDGGLVGLIIDARGRPLVLPTNELERQARLTQWMQALGG